MEPHSLVGGMGKVVGQIGAWPAASKTNASWPAHRLGRAGEVVSWRQEKMENRTVTLRLLPKGTYHVPSPPSRWAGRYQRDKERAAGQVLRKKYSLPTPSHQRRESRGKNLFPLGFFPPFLPKKWGPGWASQVPCRSNGTGENPPPPPPANPPQKPNPCAGIQTYTGGFIIVTV